MRKVIATIPLVLFIILLVTSLGIYDNFDDNSIDITKWMQFNVTVSGGGAAFSLGEENGQVDMGYSSGGVAGEGAIGINSTQIFSDDFELNWTVVSLNLGGGPPNWGACWVEIGDVFVLGSNRTGVGNPIGNMSVGNWSLKQTATDVYEIRNESTLQRTINLALDGNLKFSCKGKSVGAIGANMSIDNILFRLNTFSITLDSPDDDLLTASNLIFFNVTQGSITGQDLINSTTNIWYSNGTLFNSTLFSLSGISNTTSTLVDFNVIDTYTWGAEECLNNNTCISATNRTLNWGIGNKTTVSFNTTEYELYNSNYGIQFDTAATAVTGKLWFNGTEKIATATNVEGNTWNLNATFVPTSLDIKNNSFFFEINAGALNHNTTLNSQWINGTIFDQCNSTLTSPYINFTFTNETVAQESVTALVASSTWNYYGDDITKFKTLSFSNATENNDYTFCMEPSFKTLRTNVTFLYSNSLSEQRSYEQSSLTLTNTTLNQKLFLLPSVEGIFVTFQTIDVAEQIIKGVSANASRNGNLVGSGITNDAGIVVFFLDPDTSYDFVFSHPGFATVFTTLIPSQTSFTITMGSTTTTTVNDLTRGIVYHILPTNKTIANQTTYTFSFELGSSFWTIDSFGFGIRNGSHLTTLNYTSVNSNGGLASLTLNTGNHESLVMDAFWIINGNITNITDPWWTFDGTGTEHSVRNFIDRLRLYLGGDGLFGLKFGTFGFALLIYMIIFMAVGFMSFKFGITSSNAIMFLVFSIVYLFDVVLGWFKPLLNTSVPIATLITTAALIFLMIREANK